MKTFKQFHTRCFILIAMVFLQSASADAQENLSTDKIYGGVGYFQTGYAFFSQENLNDLLSAYGIPEVQNGSVSFGGGGHSIVNSFIIGGEGHGLIGGTSTNDEYTVSQGGGYGFFNLGYLILQKSMLTLYPVLGIGGGGYSITITDRAALPSNFNDLLADPKTQSTLSKGGFMLNFSLGADFMVAAEQSAEGYGGFIVGIRGGYLLELNKNQWHVADQELAGGPDAGISGPFIRLTIGGGGFSR